MSLVCLCLAILAFVDVFLRHITVTFRDIFNKANLTLIQILRQKAVVVVPEVGCLMTASLRLSKGSQGISG